MGAAKGDYIINENLRYKDILISRLKKEIKKLKESKNDKQEK